MMCYKEIFDTHIDVYCNGEEESYHIKINNYEAVVINDNYGRVVDRYVIIYYARYENSRYLLERKIKETETINIETILRILETYYTRNKGESYEYKWRKHKKKMIGNISLSNFFNS